MALLVSKVPSWEGASKGVFTIWDTQSCALPKTLFVVLSANHSFAEIKECKLKKQKFTKNWWLFANMPKRFFGGVFIVFMCFSFWGGQILFPQKVRLSNPSLLPIVCFPRFPFVFFSKFHLFSLLFVHQQLFGKHYFLWFLLSLICLFLCQCLLVSLKQSFLITLFQKLT